MPTAMPLRAVDQQVGNGRRQHRRFLQPVVEVQRRIDRFLVDVRQHFVGDLRHPAFGVPVRRRAVAVDRAEVALAVDERIPHAPFLGHAHQRVVHGLVAVRVVFPSASPTTPAHFRNGRLLRNANSCITYKMRRCTGLSPSRTSGSARLTITLME
jgi:hypothetical protein